MREPIVSSKEMARIEQLALSDGASELEFIEAVGRAVAERLHVLLQKKPHITILAGKGNNGADAYCTGCHLKRLGFSVTAYSLSDSQGPQCQKMRDRFVSEVGPVHDTSHIDFRGVILDGLVGTGFTGKAEGMLAQVIAAANTSGLPIYALDIPSGLDGNTGMIGSVAIQAAHTFYLGLPKIGFFLGQGWDHVGHLEKIAFGLTDQAIKKAHPLAFLFQAQEAILPKIKRSRHKYEAGYVLSVAGSYAFSGAAILSSYAALRAGAGIVRLFHPYGMEFVLSQSPCELIKEGWDLKNPRSILQEAKRAGAILIGPGMGQAKKIKTGLQKLLSGLSIPCVLDADALYFLSLFPSWKLPKDTVLTPHHGEMQRLFAFHSPLECQEYVEKKQVTLILKGGPTWIFHPQEKPTLVMQGTPGMATAGAGDVLTGIVAALLAQGCPPLNAARLGCFLHGLSGEIAADKLTPYGIIASDLIFHLPEAFRKISREYRK